MHVWVKGEKITGFWWGNLKVRHSVECLRVDGRVILKWILKEIDWEGGVVGLAVAERRDNWRAFVNKGSRKYEKFCDWLGNLAFQEGLFYRYMHFVITYSMVQSSC